MTENAEGVTGDLTADLAALRQDVARLAETIGKLVQHQTQDRVRATSGEIEARIRRSPLRAMLIAFGIGVSLGMMYRPRG